MGVTMKDFTLCRESNARPTEYAATTFGYLVLKQESYVLYLTSYFAGLHLSLGDGVFALLLP
jgi:hypothetical protein